MLLYQFAEVSAHGLHSRNVIGGICRRLRGLLLLLTIIRVIRWISGLKMPTCDMCLVAVAIWDCAICKSSKCQDCDIMYHKPAKRASHKRTKLTVAAPFLGGCNDKMIDLREGSSDGIGPEEGRSSSVQNMTKDIDLSFITKNKKVETTLSENILMGRGAYIDDYGNQNDILSRNDFQKKYAFGKNWPNQQGHNLKKDENHIPNFLPPFGTAATPSSGNISSDIINTDFQGIPHRPYMQQILFEIPKAASPVENPRFPNAPYVPNTAAIPPNEFGCPLFPPFGAPRQMGYFPNHVNFAPPLRPGAPFVNPYFPSAGYFYADRNHQRIDGSKYIEKIDLKPVPKSETVPKKLEDETKESKKSNKIKNSMHSEHQVTMNFCVYCGSKVFEEFKFCSSCGNKIQRGQNKSPEAPILNSCIYAGQNENGKITDENKSQSSNDEVFLVSKNDGNFERKNASHRNQCQPTVKQVIGASDWKKEKDFRSAIKETKRPRSPNMSSESHVGTARSRNSVHSEQNISFRYEDDVKTDDQIENEANTSNSLATIAFIKNELLNGSNLNDLEVLFSTGHFCPEHFNIDSYEAILSDNLAAVNDAFGPMLNFQMRVNGKMKLVSKAESVISLEATAFDSIKASKFLVNLRTHVSTSYFDSKIPDQLFHDKMLQCHGDARKAAWELEMGLINKITRSRVWNTDENENVLEGAKKPTFFENLSTKSMTDVLLEEAVKTYKLLPPKERSYAAKDQLARRIMAEKELVYARALLMISMLLSTETIDYISAFLTANNLTQGNVVQRKGYLTYFKECIVCCETFVQDFIIKFPNCDYQCSVCVNCVRDHFTAQISGSGKQVGNIECPGCSEKVLSEATNTLVLLQLKNVLPPNLFGLFERRALDNFLENEGRFKWCAHNGCDDGIFWENANVLKMRCSNGHHTCFNCGRKWQDQHDGRTCEEFSQWELENDPAYQNKKLDGFLRAMDAMICPSCNYRYELVRGGCLHFTCSRCGCEFCGFCYSRMSRECRKYERCANLRLHAHCPR